MIDVEGFKKTLDEMMDEDGSIEGSVIDLFMMTIEKEINDTMRVHESKYHMGDVK